MQVELAKQFFGPQYRLCAHQESCEQLSLWPQQMVDWESFWRCEGALDFS